MKLLRPLHRQRTRRRNKARILNSEDLLLLLEVDREDLEAYLNARRLPFHKDSCGEIWLSTFTDDELTERANELIPNSSQMDLDALFNEEVSEEVIEERNDELAEETAEAEAVTEAP